MKVNLVLLLLGISFCMEKLIKDKFEMYCDTEQSKLNDLLKDDILRKSLKPISKGSYGEVSSFMHPSLKRLMAKKMFKVTMKNINDVSREIRFLKELSSIPFTKRWFIVNIVDKEPVCYYTKTHVIAVMEFYDTNLKSFLQDKSAARFNESLMWKLYASLAIIRSVIKFHELGYLHRDINLSNILVRNNFEIVLADFNFVYGLDTKVSTDGLYKDDDIYGTPGYISFEVRTQEIYSVKSDAYSLGITLLLLYTHQDNKDVKADEIPFLAHTKCQKHRSDVKYHNSMNITDYFFCKYIYNILSKMIEGSLEIRADVISTEKAFLQAVKDILAELVRHETLIDTDRTVRKYDADKTETAVLLPTTQINNDKDRVELFLEEFENYLYSQKSRLKEVFDIIMSDNQVFFDYRKLKHDLISETSTKSGKSLNSLVQENYFYFERSSTIYNLI